MFSCCKQYVSLLCCDAVTHGERYIRTVFQVSVFRRSCLPLSLGRGLTTSILSLVHWIWRRKTLPKCWYLSTILHDAIFRKTEFLLAPLWEPQVSRIRLLCSSCIHDWPLSSANIDRLMHCRFWDIPSPWWQASTVLVGVGSALSLLVAITATAACCITYVVHTGTARIAGTLQFIAGQ